MPTSDTPKERVTIRLDKEIMEYFRDKSAQTEAPYQTLINSALKKQIAQDKADAHKQAEARKAAGFQ